MIREIICISTVLALALTLFAVPCFALNLSGDVIEISSVKDLQDLHAAVTQDTDYELRDKKFILVNDIKNYKGSIGNSSYPFLSEFDGCGHTITLKDSSGLFGNICGGTVKNLIIKGTVFGSGDIGGIAARVSNGTRIINCSNYATVSSNYPKAGGIVGFASLDDDSSGGVVFAPILDGRDADVLVENCANYGTISAPSFAGAICGKAAIRKDGYSDSSAFNLFFINNCYFGGTVNDEVKDDRDYEQLNEAVSDNPEYLPWIDSDDDGIPELDYSLLEDYTGSFVSDGSIAIVFAIAVIAGMAALVIKKRSIN